RESQTIKNSFALDEWGYDQKSAIEVCEMKFGDKTYSGTRPRPDMKGKIDAIGFQTQEISLKHGQEVVMVSKGYEIKPANSEHLTSFRYPTVNPTVDVEMPLGFSHSFGFGVPDEKITKSNIVESYKLDGTHFPGQYMRLRWWPSG